MYSFEYTGELNLRIDSSTYLNKLIEMDNIITSVKSMFNKNDEDFTAERAWIETTYGTGSYQPIEKRIAEKQSYIKSVIKGKFYSSNEVGNILSRAYRCVIDI